MMTTQLRQYQVASIQMASGPSVPANLNEAERLIATASEQGAKLVVLPEYFCIMGMKDTDKVYIRERFGDGPLQEFLSKVSAKYGVWLVGGTIPLEAESPKKVRNASLLYNDKGKCVDRYDKIHLFALDIDKESYSEYSTIESGYIPTVSDTPFGKIALSICYDLRFPELYRTCGDVNLIIVPAAFTEITGRAHWEVLLRARAIENLAYVIASDQGGYHRNGRETHGDSMIIDPWGNILDRLPRGSGIVMAKVDLDYQAKLRENLPALKHRVLF